MLKRFVGFLALALGVLGVVACGVGGYGVHLVSARLERANEKVFALFDKGLSVVQDRVRGVQQRVSASKITTSEITQHLRDWATRKVEDRLVTRLEVERRAERLAGALETADVWLATSAESVHDVQQVLELGQTFGAAVDPTALKEVLEALAILQGTLQETKREVDEVREFATTREGESEENRIARVLKVLGRVILMITDADSHLQRLVTRLSELRSDSQRLKVRTSNYIFWATVGCYVILAWVAVAQVTLCLWGWKHFRRRRSVLPGQPAA